MLKPCSNLARLSLALAAIVVCSVGCQQKEKVLDIETPGVNIEIERDKESGKVDVDVNG